MPYLLVIFFLCYIIYSIGKSRGIAAALKGAKREQPPRTVNDDNVRRAAEHRYILLENAGYFKYTDKTAVGTYKTDIIDTLRRNYFLGVPDEKSGSFDILNRLYSSDSEELAEGRIGEYLKNLTCLKKMGITLKIKESYPEIGQFPAQYTLMVNGKEYTAWSVQNDNDTATIWTSATLCYLNILNDILASAGVADRAYCLQPGTNDCFLYIMTPEQYSLFQAFGAECEVAPFYTMYTEQNLKEAIDEWGKSKHQSKVKATHTENQ